VDRIPETIEASQTKPRHSAPPSSESMDRFSKRKALTSRPGPLPCRQPSPFPILSRSTQNDRKLAPHSVGPPPSILPEDLRQSLLRGRPQSAPGPDGIPYQCLHEAADIITPYPRPILNRCLQLGYFPAAWKQGTTLTIPKPNKPNHLPTSYRPITLLNTLGKTFERILLFRLQTHLSTARYHHSSQHGFLLKDLRTQPSGHSIKKPTPTLNVEPSWQPKYRHQQCLRQSPHPIILQQLIQAQAPNYLIQTSFFIMSIWLL